MENERLKKHLCLIQQDFPLSSIAGVSHLFERILEQSENPSRGLGDFSILLVSLILGYFEHALIIHEQDKDEPYKTQTVQFPSLSLTRLEALILDFFHLLEYPSVSKLCQPALAILSRHPEVSKKRKAYRSISKSKRARRISTSSSTSSQSTRTCTEMSPDQSIHHTEDVENPITVIQELSMPSQGALSTLLTKWRGSKPHDLTQLLWKLTCLICRSLNPRHTSKGGSGDPFHRQSAFAFTHHNQLDTFGLALVVTAAWRALGLEEFGHCVLSLTEDHAWVEIEPTTTETTSDAEICPTSPVVFDVTAVAAHFDKIHQQPTKSTHLVSSSHSEVENVTSSVEGVEFEEDSRMLRYCRISESEWETWMYLHRHAIRCSTDAQCLAAVVTALDATVRGGDSLETGKVPQPHKKRPTTSRQCQPLQQLQHRLLHLLYQRQYHQSATETSIRGYPLALTTLAELCESNPETETCQRVSTLYTEAIEACRSLYDDRLVYPYFAQANYCSRQARWSEVIHHWADAANAISRYKYTGTDTEVYNDFLEIACQRLPQMMRLPESGPILKDSPEAFSDFLRFFDGICLWEEGSPRPVLHIVWAQKFIAVLQAFNPSLRTHLHFLEPSEVDKPFRPPSPLTHEIEEVEHVRRDDGANQNEDVARSLLLLHQQPEEENLIVTTKASSYSPTFHEQCVNSVDSGVPLEDLGHPSMQMTGNVLPSVLSGVGSSSLSPSTPFYTHLLEESEVHSVPGESQNVNTFSCPTFMTSESTLLHDFFQPTSESGELVSPLLPDIRNLVEEFISHTCTTSAKASANLQIQTTATTSKSQPSCASSAVSSSTTTTTTPTLFRHQLGPTLHSRKMLSVRHLLTTWKVNASAIELLLTAQMQVAEKGKGAAEVSSTAAASSESAATTAHHPPEPRLSKRRRIPRLLDYW